MNSLHLRPPPSKRGGASGEGGRAEDPLASPRDRAPGGTPRDPLAAHARLHRAPAPAPTGLPGLPGVQPGARGSAVQQGSVPDPPPPVAAGAEGWGRYQGYLDLMGRPEAAMPEPPVVKTAGWRAAGGEASAIQAYVDAFEVLDPPRFEAQIAGLAAALGALDGPYACVVSGPGKSNFWVTGKVLLELAGTEGARPPAQIIEVPVKEQGAMQQHVSVELREGVQHVVYLDDAAYSGSQMAALIERVKQALPAAEVHHHAGLVAASEPATSRVREAGASMLGHPLGIGEHAGALPSSREPGPDDTHGEGSYLMAMPYKVPDFASVRTGLLTDPAVGAVGEAPAPALRNYDPSRATGVDVVPRRGGPPVIRPRAGVKEPYKRLERALWEDCLDPAAPELAERASGPGSREHMAALGIDQAAPAGGVLPGVRRHGPPGGAPGGPGAHLLRRPRGAQSGAGAAGTGGGHFPGLAPGRGMHAAARRPTGADPRNGGTE